MTDILVIDDERDICEILKEILSDAGHLAESAASAAQAFEMIELHQPKLIICDISMPRQTGLEFLAELRKKGLIQAVVMLTAHSESEIIIQALQLGAVDYLVKPFSSEDVIARVPAWIEIGKRLQTVFCKREQTVDSLSEQMRMIELFRLKNHRHKTSNLSD